MTPLLETWPVILTLVIAFLIYKLIKWLIWFRRYQALHNSFPGESDFHWLLGNFHLFPGPNDKGLRYLCNLAERFPKFSRMWLGPFYPILFLYHPDTIRKVLKSSAPKTRSKYRSSLYDMVKPWLGEGLLISNGIQWSRNRRLLNPGFHFDILKPYVSIYNSAADVLVEKFSESAKRGESVDMFKVLSLCSLDIILQCAFSYESKCQLPGNEMEYVKAVDDLQECWMNRAMKPWLAADWIYNFTSESKKFRKICDFVHNVTENLIDKRRKTMVINELEHDIRV